MSIEESAIVRNSSATRTSQADEVEDDEAQIQDDAQE